MQCERLIIVAGPTCAGKTSIIDGLQGGKFTSLPEALNIKSPTRWKNFAAADLERYRGPGIDRLILHYDIVYRLRSITNFEEDNALDMIETSNEIKIITLWATPEILIPRLKARQVRVIRESLISINLFKMYGALQRWRNISRLLYNLHYKPDYLITVYNKWFDYCGKYEVESHWLINCSENKPILLPLSHWHLLRTS